MKLFKRCIAEFIGTAVLVLFACGVAVWTHANPVATSLAFGLVIVAMAYSIGNISGCHINPAVSIAMLITKKMNVKEFFAYVGSQFLGATVGALILGVLFGDFTNLGGNAIQSVIPFQYSNEFVGYLVALLAEIILTFVFVLTILGVTSKKEYTSIAPLAIGGALCLVHLLGLYLTGTSVNPARSFGPALLQLFAGSDTAISQIWIFIVGPFAGGALAAITYKGLSK